MANEVRVLITAKDNASSVLDGVGNSAEKAGKAIALGLGGALVGGLVGAVTAAAGFEKTISSVGAVSGATSAQLKELSDAALRIGKDTQYGATEAASAMEVLAANGISVTDILGGAADAATTLAAAGGTSLAQAADTVSTAMAVWGASTADLTDYVNRLAGAANVSRFGVEDMSQAIAQGGGVAAAVGVDFADFAASIAATATSFSSGSDAGTSFKTFLQRLAAPAADAAKEMKALGISAFDSTGAMRPMGEIVQQLHDSLGSMSEAGRASSASIIFGSDAMRTALGLAGLTREEFDKLSKTMGDTSAADIAKQRMDNLAGAFEQLKGSLETIAIELGMRLIPVLTEMARFAAENLPKAFDAFTAELEPKIRMVGDALTQLLPTLQSTFAFFAENEGLTRALAEGLVVVTAGMVAFGVASMAASLVNPFTATLLGAEALAAGILYMVHNWDELSGRYPALQTAADGLAMTFEGLKIEAEGVVAVAGLLYEGFLALPAASEAVTAAFGDSADAFNGFVDSVLSNGDTLLGWFQDLPGNVESAVGDLSGTLYGAGGDLIEGLKTGAIDKWNDAVGWFQDLPGNIVGAIQDAADGHSPWGATMPLGEDLVAGISVGAENAAPGLRAQVSGLVADIVQTSTKALQDALSNMTGLGGNAVDYNVAQALLDSAYADAGQVFIGPELPLYGPGLDSTGTGYLSSKDIAARNKAASESARSRPAGPTRFGGSGSGSGSGGAGKTAKEIAKTAAEEFGAALQNELNNQQLEEMFGKTGAKAIEAFGDALANPKAAASLPAIITKLVAEAKAEGVPNADALGTALAEAIAEGLRTGTNESVTAAMAEMTTAIRSAGALTMDSLGAVLAEKANDAKTLAAIGSGGAAMMNALEAALTDGGRKNIAKLADTVEGLIAKLKDKAPEGQAAYLGTSLMSALERAITDKSPEATASLESLLSKLNAVMKGGAIDIRTGTVLVADSIGEMAKAFGVNSSEVVKNIQFFVDSGLTLLIGSLDKLPAAARKMIKDTLDLVIAGKISLDAALAKIAPATGVSTGAAGILGGTAGSTANILPMESMAELVKRVSGVDALGVTSATFSNGRLVTPSSMNGVLLDSAGFRMSAGDIVSAVLNGTFARDFLYGKITSQPINLTVNLDGSTVATVVNAANARGY